MKKQTLSIFVLLCTCAGAFAQIVSAPRAASTASSVFGGKASLSPISSQTLLNTNDAEAPTFYLFNNPSGGWAIIAADERCTPVLACSRTGSFTSGTISPATIGWLRGTDRSIKAIRKSGLPQSNAAKAKWSQVGLYTKAGGGEKVLETATWDQVAPFSNLCPLDGTEQTLCGCVATAMGTVMRYYKWPEHGTGTVSGYTTRTRLIKVEDTDLSSHTYDWGNMPLKYESTSSSPQKIAVASLLYDCAITVGMDFNTADKGGSGALIQNVIPALVSHFSYSNGAKLMERANYSDATWFSTLKDEIDAGRPMVYSGLTAKDEGHSFVVDGYGEDYLLHINWGWSGKGDGFYALNCLGDDETGKDKIGHIFDRGEYAVTGIKPDAEGKDEGRVELFLFGSEDFSGISLVQGSAGAGKSFVIKTGLICNGSYNNDFKGKVKAVLIDRNGNVKEDASAENEISISRINVVEGKMNGVAFEAVNCSLKGAVAPGDAIALFHSEADGNWTRIYGPVDGCTTSLLGVYDACFITGPVEYEAGRTIIPELVQGHKPIKSIVWYLDGKEMERRYAVATQGSHTLKARITFGDSTVETVIQSITVH